MTGFKVDELTSPLLIIAETQLDLPFNAELRLFSPPPPRF